MDTKFINPYLVDKPSFAGVGKNLCRAPASIGVDDYNLIRSIRPTNGTIITTQNILWKKLCDMLRDRGITDFSRHKDFEELVANLQLVDGRTTTNGRKKKQ